jgi:hypothetical protein
MKKVALFVVVFAIAMVAATSASAQPCQPTGFQGFTAALVNPGDLNGNVINASGCDIGVYYGAGAEATVKNVSITNAKRFGVLVNGDAGAAAVDILDSQISLIGDPGFTGNQYGVAIYYRAFFAAGAATGRVSGNTLTQYQKGGVVVNGPGANVQVQDNLIEGLGPVSFIAQNGIQFGFGGGGSAMRNRVSRNQYTGSSTFSGGIIVVGGPGWGLAPDGNPFAYSTGVQIVKNLLDNNDVGAALENYAAGFAAPDEATNIKVINNTIANDAMTNGYPYQVGVADVGNNDKIISNKISGAGYPTAVDADPSFTNRPKVHANR